MSPGRPRLLAALLGAIAAAACSPNRIDAVGAPGGLYDPEPDAGCDLDDLGGGGRACPSGVQFVFEARGDDAVFEVASRTTLSNRRVTCRRSYCGTGALAVTARYRWKEGLPSGDPSIDRMGELRYKFAAPVDLYGKTLTFSAYVDNFNTPLNGQLAVISRYFRQVDDGPLLNTRGWNQKGGEISVANERLKLPPDTTSLLVTEIIVQVYLATSVRSGNHESWTGEIYFDDIGWR